MTREIEVDGIEIFTRTTPCAHTCRYCLVGPTSPQNVAFSRFQAIADRFIEWAARSAAQPLRLWIGIDRSANFDVHTLKGLLDLIEKTGWEPGSRGIRLGGLHWRPDEEMRRWLKERKEIADIRSVHASIAGYGVVHDRWNGRRGDFDFLCRTMAAAADLGLRLAQRLFLTTDSLPTMDALLDRLAGIDPASETYTGLFVYRGRATRLEAYRITEAIRDGLPDRINALRKRNGEHWLSERERMAVISGEAPAVDKVHLRLEVTEDNLPYLETASCGRIFEELCQRTRRAYRSMPSRLELCEAYGDRNNQRIYAFPDDLERKWLDLHVERHALALDRALTHLAIAG
jgi:hypothetical protein